jgi:G3E family GTPase
VVDAFSFFDYLENTKILNEELVDAEEDDTERTVATLLVEQVEFANLVIINKISLVNKKSLLKLKGFIKTINPTAEILCTNYSKVPLEKLLNTNKFNMEEAEKSSDWLKSLDEVHIPETEEYGISSFIYKSDRPFHSSRLFHMVCKYFMLLETGYEKQQLDDNKNDENDIDVKPDTVNAENIDEDVMEKERQERMLRRSTSAWRGLMRSKGYFWLATRPDCIGSWAIAGSLLNVDYAGDVKFGDADEEGNEDEENNEDVIEMESCPLVSPNGEEIESENPPQQLVFIGSFEGDEKVQVRKDLDSCLLTDEEMEVFNAGDLAQFEDPWEEWPEDGNDKHNHDHDHNDNDNDNEGGKDESSSIIDVDVDVDDDLQPTKKQKK